MGAPTNYLTTSSAIVNEAIDMLGESGQIIGAITDGTPVAETARRNYGQALRQLLRTAHWDFARSRQKLQLLGDAVSGGTLPIGVSSFVECPWSYAYAWPIDGVQGRWLPWNPTNAQPTNNQGVPLTTGVSSLVGYPQTPGRFLVSSSDQYPIEVGIQPWNHLPDLQRTFGVGPTYRKVILTDCCDAWFVYTRFVPVIEEWDALFRQALVTMMALAILPVAIKDLKVQLPIRDRLALSLKTAIADARVANGNESGMPQSVDFEASFIRARNQGVNWWGAGFGGFIGPLGGGGFGGYGLGWESMNFCGSVY